ncbi:MAG TPA: DUF2937 family protein [Roseiarcus sp.]|nr:DUF2937 family protein [Roseiarcus sp.]
MLARALALAIAVVAGLIGSQGPEFAQQYRQRAGGALDELKRIVARFDTETAHEGLTPADGVRRLEAESDPLARRRGEDMERTIARTDRLETQLAAMATAGPLKRLYVMVENFDPGIARRTLEAYEPATPLTFESLVAAGVAALLGWTGTHLVAWPFRRRSRLRTQGAREG